jgi:2-polyprenyl-6-hydroxyphenyl methylase/3-demethylubiquinone-9 3-methyltransferase
MHQTTVSTNSIIMPPADITTDYAYRDTRPNPSHAYLWPVLHDVIAHHDFSERRAIDVGCGNGATSQMLVGQGFDVLGIDSSESGVALAKQAFPKARFAIDSVYEDLAGKHGTFHLCVSLEVVEHLYSPRALARVLFQLTGPGGVAVVSTPFHGYWKNLALAVTGRWDRHLEPLRDGGHIKFFSALQLKALLADAGFQDVRILRTGRVASLAKSMVAVCRK